MNTKKTLVSAAIAITILAASTGAVFAQTISSDEMGRGYGVSSDETILDEYMISAAAEALGMDENEVRELYASGNTLTDVALAQGFSFKEATTLLQTVRMKAIEMAVADGVLSSEQAEWMQTMQYGSNARGEMDNTWSGVQRFDSGICQEDYAPLYLNAMDGSGQQRGGRR